RNEPVPRLGLVGSELGKDLARQRPHDKDEGDGEAPVEPDLDPRNPAQPEARIHGAMVGTPEAVGSRALGILPIRPESGGGGMADALVSGASVRKDVEVQLLSAAPSK